ncbi:hypothetical protein HPP92_019228 [Vanilla planifolia]|uniref:Late embryogenesis abundant protein LEA-2 subgroup domain-containing protein n=1 Tax=Vanilla planifolia TaxID=51239 RepID=A0A835Q3N8_VANPL|nr:hypothetical protein HPP92_019228 [Vanilla planifolia]
MAPSTPPFHFLHRSNPPTIPMKTLGSHDPSSENSPTTPSQEPPLLRPPTAPTPIWFIAPLRRSHHPLLIAVGIVTLVVFLVIKPRNPSFDTTNVLNSIYLDSSAYLNGDLTFLANFSNPNSKIDLFFEYASVELFFSDRLVAAQALQPFAQRRGEARLEAVHMISSQVYLPPQNAAELVRQSEAIGFSQYKGAFKVRASVGIRHFSFGSMARRQIEPRAAEWSFGGEEHGRRDERYDWVHLLSLFVCFFFSMYGLMKMVRNFTVELRTSMVHGWMNLFFLLHFLYIFFVISMVDRTWISSYFLFF